jgi:cysteine desulfurase
MKSEPFIYLDHHSTTPLHPQVAQVLAECYAQPFYNPASQHRAGQIARRALEDARRSIIQMLGGESQGMKSDTLILTSGGTESNNLALIGLALHAFEQRNREQPPLGAGKPSVLISAIEHPSTLGAGEQLARLGFEVQKIEVDRHGVVKLEHLESLLQSPTMLVSIMLANNETGVIQPVKQAAGICQRQGVLMHTDAVQAVGKVGVDFRDLGVAAMSFTAHKFNGPRGIGGLLLRHGVELQPTLFGGFQQMARRPGTEDVALTMGMEKSLKIFFEDPQRMDRVAQLRDQLQSELISDFPQAIVIGDKAQRLPTALNIAFPGLDRQAFVMAADIAGVAVSTGSACASGSSETSPVLRAMKLPEAVCESAIRISLGAMTTAEEIEMGAGRISNILKQLWQRSNLEIQSLDPR